MLHHSLPLKRSTPGKRGPAPIVSQPVAHLLTTAAWMQEWDIGQKRSEHSAAPRQCLARWPLAIRPQMCRPFCRRVLGCEAIEEPTTFTICEPIEAHVVYIGKC
jgi:hypothetical protein